MNEYVAIALGIWFVGSLAAVAVDEVTYNNQILARCGGLRLALMFVLGTGLVVPLSAAVVYVASFFSKYPHFM